MTMSGAGTGPDGRVTTQRVAEARESITRESVAPRSETSWQRFVDRLTGVYRGERTPAQEPYPGTSQLRIAMSGLFAILCTLTVGGAILLLLLWQQSRDTGVLTSQLDRTWDLLGVLQDVERWVAYAVVPIAMAWIALAAINAGRATGNHRNPTVAALSLPIGLFGIWFVGRELVAGSEDAVTQGAGWVLQLTLLGIPMIFLERITTAAEARHRPLRATFLIAAAFLAQLQFLGGLSTIDRGDATDRWGEIGAYLLICGLIQVLGSLAANEAARAVEDASMHRYQLRSRFSESLLAQAARS
jgi:hypothetical protein